MDRLLRILVINDSPSPEESITISIPKYDTKISVDVVFSLAEAEDRLARQQYNAVLLDLNFPDAGDVETVVRLQSLYPELPLVVLSGKEVDMEGDTMRAGADSYLVKGSDTSPATIIRELRHAVIRGEVNRRYRQAHEGMATTQQVIEEARNLEKQVEEKLQ